MERNDPSKEKQKDLTGCEWRLEGDESLITGQENLVDKAASHWNKE